MFSAQSDLLFGILDNRVAKYQERLRQSSLHTISREYGNFIRKFIEHEFRNLIIKRFGNIPNLAISINATNK